MEQNPLEIDTWNERVGYVSVSGENADNVTIHCHYHKIVVVFRFSMHGYQV